MILKQHNTLIEKTSNKIYYPLKWYDNSINTRDIRLLGPYCYYKTFRYNHSYIPRYCMIKIIEKYKVRHRMNKE